MRTLQEKYNAVLEGNFSKTQFRRDAAIEMPQFVSTVNSFDDTVAILKNKGAITEAKAQEPKYSTAKPADTIAPDVLDTGIKFELDKKYGTLDVTPEQYEKAKEAAVKNLAKDVLYYVKQDSVQLDTPGEKMEKAKVVKEEISKEEDAKAKAWKEYQEKRGVTSHTIVAAEKDFNKGWEEGKYRDGNYMAETVDRSSAIAAVRTALKGKYEKLEDRDIAEFLQVHLNDFMGEDPDVDINDREAVVDNFESYIYHNEDSGDIQDMAQRIGFFPNEEDDLGTPDTEDLYQKDSDYLANLKERKALKEMFKKIIVNLINE